MSIINEALKKTQQVRSASKEKSAKPREERSSAHEPIRLAIPPARLRAASKVTALRSLHAWLSWKVALGLGVVVLALFLYSQHAKHQGPLISQANPVTTPSGQKRSVVFEGILLADNQRIALINDQTMRLGDSLQGMKIVAIDRESVRLQGDKGVVEIKAGATYEL